MSEEDFADNVCQIQLVQLKEIMVPIVRPEIPIPGKIYRQLGVKLWGQGAYEREAIEGSQTKYKTLSMVQENDIVVNKIWARNGAVAVVPKDLSGCFVSGEFPTFSPVHDKMVPRWFHWITKTNTFWRKCDEKSQGTSGKNRIRPEKFLEIEIPLPPVLEQRRIVARIEELAARIEGARELRRRAVEEAKALSKISLDREYSLNMSRFGGLPLEDACTIITDGDHLTPSFTDSGIKFIFVGNVSSGFLHFNGCKYVDPEYFASIIPHRKPQKDDILYSAVGATLGIPAIVNSNEEFCFQRHIALISAVSIKLK